MITYLVHAPRLFQGFVVRYLRDWNKYPNGLPYIIVPLKDSTIRNFLHLLKISRAIYTQNLLLFFAILD